jgi:hypothetical protein
MAEEQTKVVESEREILKALIDSGAVNFEAIGAALAKFGPRAALSYDGYDNFCLTMKNYVQVYRFSHPSQPRDLADLAKLREMVGSELLR